MKEMLTEEARKVLKLASEEAYRLNHEYIGTEHLLLGLCLLYTSPSPRDRTRSRMPSSA